MKPIRSTQLTLVIPTLNEARTLPQLLGDLCRQTNQKFNVIIVDGQSQDDTVNLALSFRPRLPHLKVITSTQQNVGAQRNFGAQTATTRDLLFLDADDRLPSEFIHDLHKSWLQHKPDFYTTTFIPNNPKISYRLSLYLSNVFFRLMSYTAHPYVTECVIGINRQAFLTVGGFDLTFPHGEGNDLASRLIQAGFTFRLFNTPQYVYSMRRTEADGLIKNSLYHLYLGFLLFLHLPIAEKTAQTLYPMKGGTHYEK